MAKKDTDKKLDKQLAKVGGTLSEKELEQIKKRLGISGGVREAAQEAGIKLGDSLVKDKPAPKPTPGPTPKPTPILLVLHLNLVLLTQKNNITKVNYSVQVLILVTDLSLI